MLSCHEYFIATCQGVYMASKKPSLSAALQSANTIKPTIVDIAVKENSDRPKSRQGKKAISGFFDPVVSKQLKQIALDKDTTVQSLLTEALNDLFVKYSYKPLA